MSKGFTIVELLVVIAIISILAGLSFPLYSHVVESGHATGCVSNQRQLAVALNLYLGDHNATMPTLVAARSSTTQDAAAIDNTLNAYAPNQNVFICPSDYPGIGKATGTSYFWNSALNGQSVASLNFLTTTDLSRIPVLSDKQGFHPYIQNKVNVLYADGHATKDLQFFTNP
jgi:prepilin-type N-terminal cleavage/methylation domain-containing protein/prepilin-type processing-associated H-X9-DG protein